MYAQITVHSRAIEAEVDPERDGGPGGIFGTAVEADFVGGGGAAELVEEGLGGGFGGEVGHGGATG